jgi:hypothetical protein
MDPKLINFLGLLFAMAGAITVAFGLILPNKRSREAALPRLASERDELNQCLPQVRDRMRISRFALIGILIMALGFLLQIIGNWPGL